MQMVWMQYLILILIHLDAISHSQAEIKFLFSLSAFWLVLIKQEWNF